MTDKLKPCPFCGSKNIIKRSNNDLGVYQVLCNLCISSTGLHEKQKQAIDAWNTRPQDKLQAFHDKANPVLEELYDFMLEWKNNFPKRDSYALNGVELTQKHRDKILQALEVLDE